MRWLSVWLLAACTGPGSVVDKADDGQTDTVDDTEVDDTNGSDDTDLTDTDSVAACTMLPADNPWNTDIRGWDVHERSSAWVNAVGGDLHPDFGTRWEGNPNGIPSYEIDADTPLREVSFLYADESDPGPYPIPDDPPIEGGPDGDGDRHVIGVDWENCLLYELFDAWPQPDGSWTAGSGAIFDLTTNDLRPDGWTSADAAGLPILPGLVRYQEVMSGEIGHALRFTTQTTQRAYIHPATHAASQDTSANLPPMGARYRMRADYDCTGFSTEVQVICSAFKTYGMFMADNGGNGYVSGSPDDAWDDDNLRDMKQIGMTAFEVVDSGPVVPY